MPYPYRPLDPNGFAWPEPEPSPDPFAGLSVRDQNFGMVSPYSGGTLGPAGAFDNFAYDREPVLTPRQRLERALAIQAALSVVPQIGLMGRGVQGAGRALAAEAPSAWGPRIAESEGLTQAWANKPVPLQPMPSAIQGENLLTPSALNAPSPSAVRGALNSPAGIPDTMRGLPDFAMPGTRIQPGPAPGLGDATMPGPLLRPLPRMGAQPFPDVPPTMMSATSPGRMVQGVPLGRVPPRVAGPPPTIEGPPPTMTSMTSLSGRPPIAGAPPQTPPSPPLGDWVRSFELPASPAGPGGSADLRGLLQQSGLGTRTEGAALGGLGAASAGLGAFVGGGGVEGQQSYSMPEEPWYKALGQKINERGTELGAALGLSPETLARLASPRFSHSDWNAGAAASSPAASPPPPSPPSTPTSMEPSGSPQNLYTVQPGNWLSTIAQSMLGGNASPAQVAEMVQKIAALNEIQNVNQIRSGQQLALPMPVGRDPNSYRPAPQASASTLGVAPRVFTNVPAQIPPMGGGVTPLKYPDAYRQQTYEDAVRGLRGAF